MYNIQYNYLKILRNTIIPQSQNLCVSYTISCDSDIYDTKPLASDKNSH